jgi:hypothetical protein
MDKNQSKPNFKTLWTQAMTTAKDTGDSRVISVLENHKENPERICRKLGIICNADILRLKKTIESKKGNRQQKR